MYTSDLNLLNYLLLDQAEAGRYILSNFDGVHESGPGKGYDLKAAWMWCSITSWEYVIVNDQQRIVLIHCAAQIHTK